jgi:CCR4-NOT transcriptional regulation complex NOT5 subunit
MDTDVANATQFKKLMPEEHAQLTKEGRCFRCQLQGHMACNCPKNTNNTSPTICTNDTTSLSKENTTSTPPTTTAAANKVTMKLTRTQQICTIEEAMMNEEQSEYLDTHDMGQDSWSARA